MHIENFIENIYRDIDVIIFSEEYVKLYGDINNEKLTVIFSSLHNTLIAEFKLMNQRLPTKDNTAYFWADNSRKLLRCFELIDEMNKNLQGTEYDFSINDYYEKIIDKCKGFLEEYNGSTIPEYFDKVELYYTIPIFNFNKGNVLIKKNKSSFKLQLIGEGSFAKVSKYYDEDYDEIFVIKKLKTGLKDKDAIRFRQEYILMKENPHPNIVKVYKYFDDNSYTMEFGGLSLKKFIDKNNTKISKEERMNLIFQLLRSIKFLHSRGLYHRDISYNNILINEQYGRYFLKISDFGLAKDEQNLITSDDSSMKGTYLDPCLDKFGNYSAQNDIYALGMMINYIYYGRQNVRLGTAKIDKIINKCITNNLNTRYRCIDEIMIEISNNKMVKDEFYSRFDVKKLKEQIIAILSNYSANDLPDICEGLGLKAGTIDESYRSKAGYISRRIITLSKEKTIDLIIKINEVLGIDISIQ